MGKFYNFWICNNMNKKQQKKFACLLAMLTGEKGPYHIDASNLDLDDRQLRMLLSRVKTSDIGFLDLTGNPRLLHLDPFEFAGLWSNFKVDPAIWNRFNQLRPRLQDLEFDLKLHEYILHLINAFLARPSNMKRLYAIYDGLNSKRRLIRDLIALVITEDIHSKLITHLDRELNRLLNGVASKQNSVAHAAVLDYYATKLPAIIKDYGIKIITKIEAVPPVNASKPLVRGAYLGWMPRKIKQLTTDVKNSMGSTLHI